MNKSNKAIIDPASVDILLRWFQKLTASHGPQFTWWVIDFCYRNKRPFPDWVNAYLGQCARRIGSDHAKQDTLQEIFGFPKKKPGPGGLFDRDREVIREAAKGMFTLGFAVELRRLRQSETAYDARSKAAARVYKTEAMVKFIAPQTNDGAFDDKTLLRDLKEQLQLKKLPRTIEGWMDVTDFDGRRFEAIVKRYISFLPD
jgi:hypothetical protein